jgi:O-antigen ligase
MDSTKRYWRGWGLFDGGRLPVGHMHSTVLQIALERGLPALFAWLALLFFYARMLFKLLWRQNNHMLEWDERGVLLGAAGGLVGFVSSGMVHYNLGDSEVAMVFYLIMGLTLVLEREQRSAS